MLPQPIRTKKRRDQRVCTIRGHEIWSRNRLGAGHRDLLVDESVDTVGARPRRAVVVVCHLLRNHALKAKVHLEPGCKVKRVRKPLLLQASGGLRPGGGSAPGGIFFGSRRGPQRVAVSATMPARGDSAGWGKTSCSAPRWVRHPAPLRSRSPTWRSAGRFRLSVSPARRSMPRAGVTRDVGHDLP